MIRMIHLWIETNDDSRERHGKIIRFKSTVIDTSCREKKSSSLSLSLFLERKMYGKWKINVACKSWISEHSRSLSRNLRITFTRSAKWRRAEQTGRCGLREKFGIWECEKRRKLTGKWWTGRGGQEVELKLWGGVGDWYFDGICGLLRGKERWGWIDDMVNWRQMEGATAL